MGYRGGEVALKDGEGNGTFGGGLQERETSGALGFGEIGGFGVVGDVE